MSLPNDPAILLSVINTRLRDRFDDLDLLCEDADIARDELCARLERLGYQYDRRSNQFR